MKKYNFRWRLVPSLPQQRPQQLEMEGFTVELSSEGIVCRTSFTTGAEHDLHPRALAVARSILLATSFLRKHKTTLELDYVKYECANPSDGQIVLRLHDQMPKSVDEVSMRMSYVKLDGTIVEKFLDDDSARIADLSSRIRESAALQQMLEWRVEFDGDPDRKLAPLYNIIELARGEANDAEKLGVSKAKLKKATGIMNNESIRTSRHPGQRQGALREITEDELRFCREVVDSIIESSMKMEP